MIAVIQNGLLGRRSAGFPGTKVVDLEPYRAFEKGVSRNHLKITHQESAFLAEDLGSANGTFINGLPLRAQEVLPINNGDELRLGELRLHVLILK